MYGWGGMRLYNSDGCCPKTVPNLGCALNGLLPRGSKEAGPKNHEWYGFWNSNLGYLDSLGGERIDRRVQGAPSKGF